MRKRAPLTLVLAAQMVELLFARGLVKVLFATETFAMVRPSPRSLSASSRALLTLSQRAGCQHAGQVRRVLGHPQARRAQLPRAPAGRVVRPPLSLPLGRSTSCTTDDNADARSTQMSGRAGRRGLDKTGVVIINADSEVPDVRPLLPSAPLPWTHC